MKRILTSLLTWLAFGLPSFAAAANHSWVAIYDDILQKNADQAVAHCTALEATLETGDEAARLTAFTDLATAWARVQASYVLGGYDDAAIDYPALIDRFHIGNEDLHDALTRIIASDRAPKSALYKTSYRSITALDDVMFSGPWSERRAALADVIAASLCSRLEKVRDGYSAQRDAVLTDPDKALGLLMNAEIESLYRTRDWRIAQVAGLTRKSLGEPRLDNQQYPWSGASWAVIGAILDAHSQLLANDRAPNLSTVAAAKGGSAGMASVQDMLLESIIAYKAVSPDRAFSPQEMVPIINALQMVQNAFYNHLALSLGVTMGIVDADGD